MAKDKRSDEVFDAMLRKALKEEFMSSMDHLPSEAVSYTHLDVYKRQLL